MSLPFTSEYRDGEIVQCQRCAKNVRVKYYDRDAVVVVSSQEQQTLALRCQYCGYVLCDSCAHPADSLFPICPACQREWGPYYFTHEAISPSSSKGVFTAEASPAAQPDLVIQPNIQTSSQPKIQPAVKPPEKPETYPIDRDVPSAPVDTLGAGETDLVGEYRKWERKAIFRKILTAFLVLVILGLLGFLAAGPGKPIIKKGLSLISTRSTHSPTTVAFIDGTATVTPQTPIKTIAPVVVVSSATTKPSSTLPAPTGTKITVKTTAAPTATPTLATSSTPTLTVAPTSTTGSAGTSDCISALSVTVDDVGKKMCVTGTVVYTMQNANAFMVYFANEDGYFRLVIYDRVPKNIKKGVCIKVTGEIKLLTGLPVMALNYNDVVEICSP